MLGEVGMPPMSFDYMSWEAFMTLLTGALAVGAALIVGMRQTDIQREQVAIQNRLADLEELKLRQALFEARYQTYNSARMWLLATVQAGTPPYSVKDLKGETREAEFRWANDFLDALDRSRFLFRPAVRAELVKMHEAGQALLQADKALERDSSSHEQREKAANKHDEAFTYLSNLLVNFSDVFGDELKLTQHQGLR